MPYFHVVFTLPASIASIAYQNKAVIYDLLFKASSEAVLTIAADPEHLGVRIGTIARGFVPWRLSDAGPDPRGSDLHGRHPKPCTHPDIRQTKTPAQRPGLSSLASYVLSLAVGHTTTWPRLLCVTVEV